MTIGIVGLSTKHHFDHEHGSEARLGTLANIFHCCARVMVSVQLPNILIAQWLPACLYHWSWCCKYHAQIGRNAGGDRR